MALSNITVKGITPNLSILGNYQRFSYEDNVASFQLDNIFVPTTLIPTRINFEFRNNQLSGFRWYHTTTSTDSFGSLALQSFVNASPNGTDILIFAQDGSVNFTAPITISSLSIGDNLDMNNYRIIDLADPVNPQDGATKAYVDGKTITLTGAVTGTGVLGTIATTLTAITVSQISNFDASVKAYRLDQFAAPITSVSFGSQKIINLLTPTLTTDAATKGYVDGKTITLTGAVTGTGVLGTIATTLTAITVSQISNFDASVKAYRLDQFAAPITSVSMGSQKIINLATPTLTTDAATKAYVDSAVTGGTTPLGMLRTSSSSGPAIAGSGTFRINEPSTLSTSVRSFDMPLNCRLRCLATSTYTYNVRAVIQIKGNVGQIFTLQITKNNVLATLLPLFEIPIQTTNYMQNLVVEPEPVTLSNGDVIDIYIGSGSSFSNLQICNVSFYAIPV